MSGRPIGLRIACFVTATLLLSCTQAFANEYRHYVIGDPSAPTPGEVSGGLLLMGGGDRNFDALRWFVAKAGHGHLVVLRASQAAEVADEFYTEVGGLASVETFVFEGRGAATDPKILAALAKADGIFIAGGDQANYVRFWKGTPLNALIDRHVRAGKPLGGTSAGLAMLGQWGYGAMDGGSITSPEALHDPDGPAVTLVDHFITVPLLRGTITDTHFVQRGRLGRLLAFVARLARDHHTAAIAGMGVDQDSALLVEADGDARLLSWHPDGHAWIVVPERLREVERDGGRAALDAYLRDRVAPGKPLNMEDFVVTGLGTDGGLKLPIHEVTHPAFRVRIDVIDGKPVEHVMLGKVPGAPGG